MAEKDKKPDLRDQTWAPKTSVEKNDRTFVEQSVPDGDDPHIAEPGPDVHVPGQTTKQ